MINIFGEEIFYIVQDTLIATSKIHNVVISSFLMIEFFNYIMTSLVAVVVIIKGFKKLLEKYRVRLVTYVPQAKKVINIEKDVHINNEGTYLVLGHLRN